MCDSYVTGMSERGQTYGLRPRGEQRVFYSDTPSSVCIMINNSHHPRPTGGRSGLSDINVVVRDTKVGELSAQH